MKLFKPQSRYSNISDINPDQFINYKIILIDVDNTLVEPETTITTTKIIQWVKNVNQKNICLLISNSPTIKNRANKLVQLFNCKILLDFQKKPNPKIIQKICQNYNIKPKEIAIIGDRILVDILLANLGQAHSIYVNPICQKENTWIKLIRPIENWLAR